MSQSQRHCVSTRVVKMSCTRQHRLWQKRIETSELTYLRFPPRAQRYVHRLVSADAVLLYDPQAASMTTLYLQRNYFSANKTRLDNQFTSQLTPKKVCVLFLRCCLNSTLIDLNFFYSRIFCANYQICRLKRYQQVRSASEAPPSGRDKKVLNSLEKFSIFFLCLFVFLKMSETRRESAGLQVTYLSMYALYYTVLYCTVAQGFELIGVSEKEFVVFPFKIVPYFRIRMLQILLDNKTFIITLIMFMLILFFEDLLLKM